MKAILSALLLLLCLNALGQTGLKNSTAPGTISGIITAKNNGMPVDGAVIILKKLNDSLFSKSTSSDKFGAFKFSNITSGSYTIGVKYVGYKDYNNGEILIDDVNISINLPAIRLDVADHNLNEVVIKSQRKAYTEQKIDRIIVNVDQLLSNTGVSAVEVLSNAPGVELIDNTLSLRGKQGVTIYIDGRQTFLTGTELVNYLNALPSGSIDKLELMPNPPVKYHVKGNSGVINIITKKNRTNGFNGNLAASYGQGRYSKSNYSLNLNYKTDKIYFSSDFAYFSKNNYFKMVRKRVFHFTDQSENYMIDQDNFETSNERSTHYKLGLDVLLDTNNKVGLIVDGMTSPYRENGNYFLQFSQMLPDSMIHTLSELTHHTRHVTLNFYYEHKFKRAGENIRIDADYLNYQKNALQVLNSNTYLPKSALLFSDYNLLTQTPFRATVYSLKSDYETKVLYRIKLSAGLQSVYSKRISKALYFNTPGIINDSLTNSSTYVEHINSAYISLDREWKKFSLSIGLRFENNSSYTEQFNSAGNSYQRVRSTNNVLFPKLYLLYKLDVAAVNTLNFSFGSQISRPGYSSLNPFAFYFDRYTILQGNAALQPERSINFDLSFSHAGAFTLGATFSKGKNKIIPYYYISGQSLVNTSFNVPNTYDFVVYTTGGLDIFKWWRANLFNELSNLSVKGVIAGNDLLNNSVLTYRLSGNNQFKLSKSWNVELSGNYRTKMTLGQGYYLPIWRINASLQKKIFEGKGTITLSGADVFHSWKIRRNIAVNNANIAMENQNDTQQLNLAFSYRFGLSGKPSSNKSGLKTERNRAGVN